LRKKQWETLTSIGDIPSPRFAHIAVLHNRKMYIHGGNEYIISPLGDFYSYDIDTKTWQKLDSTGGPSPRYYHSSALYKGRLYVFGGCSNKKVFHNDLYCYDIEASTWRKIELDEKSLPLPRGGHITFVVENKLYMFGGFGDDGGYTYREDMFYLDLEKEDKWVPLELHEGSNVPKSARCLSCVLLGDKCYVYGGYDGKVPQRSLYCFEHHLNLWTVIRLSLAVPEDDQIPIGKSSMWYEPTPRYGHSTVFDDKNNIIIYAGSGSMFLGDIMLIDTEISI